MVDINDTMFDIEWLISTIQWLISIRETKLWFVSAIYRWSISTMQLIIMADNNESQLLLFWWISQILPWMVDINDTTMVDIRRCNNNGLISAIQWLNVNDTKVAISDTTTTTAMNGFDINEINDTMWLIPTMAGQKKRGFDAYVAHGHIITAVATCNSPMGLL